LNIIFILLSEYFARRFFYRNMMKDNREKMTEKTYLSLIIVRTYAVDQIFDKNKE